MSEYKQNLIANSSGNNGTFMELKTDFQDARTWDLLAEKYLSRYNLPKWSVECTEDQMTLWVERCDLTKAEFSEYMNTSVSDWMALNPTWPLRAFIGLLLEYQDQRQNS